jgi:2-polyprenyl-3-methyl-5-hydroxy-6-metoxy-1,4-benzoquinol methylase
MRFVQGDVRRLPFDDNTFDVVICTWVVEIMDDPRAVVQEFIRVIKPDGILTLPCIECRGFFLQPGGWRVGIAVNTWRPSVQKRSRLRGCSRVPHGTGETAFSLMQETNWP